MRCLPCILGRAEKEREPDWACCMGLRMRLLLCHPGKGPKLWKCVTRLICHGRCSHCSLREACQGQGAFPARQVWMAETPYFTGEHQRNIKRPQSNTAQGDHYSFSDHSPNGTSCLPCWGISRGIEPVYNYYERETESLHERMSTRCASTRLWETI